jgi:hypothetical protein
MKFEIGLLKLSKMPTTHNIETILEKLSLIKKKTEPASELESSQNEAEKNDDVARQPSLDLNTIQNYWSELIGQYKSSKVNLANALELGKPVSLDNSELHITYSKKNSFHISWLKKNQRLIEKNLKDYFKITVKIVLDINEEEEPEPELPEDKKMDKESIKKMLKEDPLLNKLVDDLGLELT